MCSHLGKDGTKGMGRILLQLGGSGVALCLTLLLIGSVRQAAGTQVTQLQLPPTDAPSVTIPSKIAGTALVLESLAPYDGNFVEDGIGRQVSNVACIVVRNTGEAAIWLEVVVETEHETLTFHGNTVPAGSMVMILEKDAKKYPTGQLRACRGQVVLGEGLWMDEAQLEFADVDMGTVAVTNLTDGPMENVRVYYKTYHSDVGIFLGGVTYCTTIEYLPPGETVLIEPSHYARGYSRIVRVSLS